MRGPEGSDLGFRRVGIGNVTLSSLQCHSRRLKVGVLHRTFNRSSRDFKGRSWSGAGLSTKLQVDDNGKSLDSCSTLSESLEYEAKEAEDNPNMKGCTNAHSENGLSSMHTAQQKLDTLAIAKTFVGTETVGGKAVNVVHGMKMYEELVDDSGVRKMVSLVNNLRAAGRGGRFQGKS